jgi:hypothetical protein
MEFFIICRCGGIGRRARLKIVFRKECRFDPDLRYHIVFPIYDSFQIGKKYVLQQEAKHDKLDLVASAASK